MELIDFELIGFTNTVQHAFLFNAGLARRHERRTAEAVAMAVAIKG